MKERKKAYIKTSKYSEIDTNDKKYTAKNYTIYKLENKINKMMSTK